MTHFEVIPDELWVLSLTATTTILFVTFRTDVTLKTENEFVKKYFLVDWLFKFTFLKVKRIIEIP
jgi:hypothetical protein